MRKLALIVPLIIFATASVLLISASPLLTYNLSKKSFFPLGTIITWVGIISLPTFIFLAISGFRKPNNILEKIFKWIFLNLIAISSVWGILGFVLAKNWSFTFSNTAEGFRGGTAAGYWFWNLTYILVLLPVLITIIYFLFSLFKRILQRFSIKGRRGKS